MAVQKNLLESHETIFSGSKMMTILSVFPELNIHILTKKSDKTLSKSTMTHPRMHLRAVGARKVNLINLLQPISFF